MLTYCPECELQVSDKASWCPHCGYPLNETAKYKPRMKRKRRRLPNGFGQISEIKNRNLRKPFRAMVTVGKDEKGKPICKPLKPNAYFRTYNDAYSALMEYNKNPYEFDDVITMKELYNRWSKKHFKELKNEMSSVNIEKAWEYCSSIEDMLVSDIRARHLKDCIENCSKIVRGKVKYPPAHMKNKMKSMFNSMFDYALEYDLVDKNYARAFSLPKDLVKEMTVVKKEHITYTPEEMKKLWENINKYELAKFIVIQCYSGFRPSELLQLRLENINLNERVFENFGIKTETGKERIVPIHSKIESIVIDKYNEALVNGRETLFESINYSSLKDKYKSLINDLNINQNHRPHDGRKYFVTEAKRCGVDEYAIKRLVGHKISDITERVYTSRDLNWLRDEIEKIR